MKAEISDIRILINGQPATERDLEELPAPYDVRVLLQPPDVLIIEVRHPSQLV